MSDEKDHKKQVIFCVISVLVLVLIFFGDAIITRFLPVEPNPIPDGYFPDSVEEKEEEETPTVSSNSSYDVSFMKEQTILDVLKHIESGEIVYVFSGRSTCEPCKRFVPVLKEVATSKNISIDYLDRTKISKNSEGYEKFLSYSSTLSENFSKTPYFMVFKNNQYQEDVIGYQSDLTIQLEEIFQKYE